MSENLINKLPKIRGLYRADADLSKTNWFGVGGPAEVLFRPKDIEDFCEFLQNKPKEIPVTILGVGSNIIVRDGGIEGVVIKLGGEFAKISHEGELIRIGASCLCSNAALYSKVASLAGLEFLTGIPGSIGGAVAMNAGCYDGEVSKVLISAKAVDFEGNLIELKNEDFNFYYRGSKISKNYLFVEGLFKGVKSNQEEIAAKIAQFNKQREDTQPIRSKTGGSTFKNPDLTKSNGKKAWQLIDEAGCRGMKIGGAKMSEKHCNFMINEGNASAKDLIELAFKVQKMVKEVSDVELELEIKILGKD